MDVCMFHGRKIIVTGGRGYFGHKLRNELKNMGAMVVVGYLPRLTLQEGKVSR